MSGSSKSSDSSGQSSDDRNKDLQHRQDNLNKKEWLAERFAAVTACHEAINLTYKIISSCLDKIKDCVVAGLTSSENTACIRALTAELAEASYDITLEYGNQLWLRNYLYSGLEYKFSQGLQSATDANHYFHQCVSSYASNIVLITKRIFDADDYLREKIGDLTLKSVERIEIAHLIATSKSILQHPNWNQLNIIAEYPDDPDLTEE
jgi:hypothetical protein